MLYRLRKHLKTRRFESITRGIRATRPLRVIDAPWTIVSMVSNDDAHLYLVAMKSFYRLIKRGKLVAIIDRDMPEASRDLLAEHFEGIRFETLEDIDTGVCQRGGTWERLVYLVDRARDEYAIQVDCDTLTMGPDLKEVAYCVENNLPFTLADGWPLVTMSEAAREAREIAGDQPGIVAERSFDRYPNCERLLYVRGSSGFTGFAKGGFSRARLAEFHEGMAAIVGRDAWRGWATEQCASNFVTANSPSPVILPFPNYSCFFPVGPAGMLCVRRSLFEGAIYGLMSGLGAACADAFFGAIAGFGLTFIRDWLLSWRNELGLAGGALLIVLGIKSLLARGPARAARQQALDAEDNEERTAGKAELVAPGEQPIADEGQAEAGDGAEEGVGTGGP